MPWDTADGAAIDEALVRVARDTNAHVGAVYLLEPDERLLRMAVKSGMPQKVAVRWSQVEYSAPVPVALAPRENRTIWLPNHREIVRSFPRTGQAFPYEVAMCAAPLVSRDTPWGALLLLWPETHPPELSSAERRKISAACHRMTAVLRRAAEAGTPLQAGEAVRSVEPLPRRGEEDSRSEAAMLVDRLAEGMCTLDLEGRVTFHNRAAQKLLATPGRELGGARMGGVLPWLNDPAFEGPYLAALFSQLPKSFKVLRPPEHWLSFHLYPDPTGITVRILPSEAPGREGR